MSKVLTKDIVTKNGWDKVSKITADMLDGYKIIGNYAFEGCTSLTSVVIPNSVTSIGDYAFYGCWSLNSVTIGNSVTSIGDYAFKYCTSLTSVTIGNSVTSIGNYAFCGCKGLTSVTIPNSITSIGDFAFWDCSGLTSVTIPNSATSIGNNAFFDCSSLTSIIFNNKEYRNNILTKYNCKAYKAFNSDMSCRNFQYKEGNKYRISENIKLCERGFHACLNFSDLFNYYYGKLGEQIHIHEVILNGVSDEISYDSKIVAKEIIIGRRII